jgi:hypothetical protein
LTKLSGRNVDESKLAAVLPRSRTHDEDRPPVGRPPWLESRVRQATLPRQVGVGDPQGASRVRVRDRSVIRREVEASAVLAHDRASSARHADSDGVETAAAGDPLRGIDDE